MTTVTFLTEETRIVGFDARDTAATAEAGEDIVCAAVTSAVRLVEATVNDVMGLCAAVKVNPQDAAISLRLPGGLEQTAESTCQNLLTGLMVYLTPAPRRIPRQHRSHGGVSLFPLDHLTERMVLENAEHFSAVLRP